MNLKILKEKIVCCKDICIEHTQPYFQQWLFWKPGVLQLFFFKSQPFIIYIYIDNNYNFKKNEISLVSFWRVAQDRKEVLVNKAYQEAK